MEEENIKRPKPLVLVILDGWGVGQPYSGNALSEADTPFFDSLVAEYPAMPLDASGDAIGLAFGESGNCRSGHSAIATGLPASNLLRRINGEIASNRFYKNERLLKIFDSAVSRGKKVHLCGILSNASTHGSIDHLHALLVLAKERKVKDLCVHAILDGAEAPPEAGLRFVKGIERSMREYGIGRIASLSGSFYALDRGGFWDRTAKFYAALSGGEAKTGDSAEKALAESYAKRIYDAEFLPTVINSPSSASYIEDGDALIFCNLRCDGVRQIYEAMFAVDFDKFPRKDLSDLDTATFCDAAGVAPVFPFPAEGEALMTFLLKNGMRCLTISESERAGSMSFFLGSGEGELSIVPSPLADDYAKVPEMSAKAVTDLAISAVSKGDYDFIAVNYANVDAVSRSGDLAAVTLAASFVDKQLASLAKAVGELGGVIVVTADHGSGERMVDMQTETVDNSTTEAPVPFILFGEAFRGMNFGWQDVAGSDLSLVQAQGSLLDVAPTLLKILGIKKPDQMSGKPLF